MLDIGRPPAAPRPRVPRRCAPAAVLAAVLALAFAAPAPASQPIQLAARTGEDVAPSYGREDTRVMFVQEALADLGLYDGPVDGRLNAATETAIRTFQKRVGLPVDGRISDELTERLGNRIDIDNLLRRLDSTRDSDIEAARRALLDNRRTRGLVTGEADEAADPTRDPGPCFRAPTPRCLLDEAVESAKAIPRDELRDWAFGDILVAQARAGLSDDAIATVRRIYDPRLIIVALRDIAEAQAEAGRPDEAVEAAAAIPDRLKQAEALAEIADIQARRGDDPKPTLARLMGVVGSIEDAARRVAFHARAAVVAARTGDAGSAKAQLAAAETLAREQAARGDNGAALRHVATAFADIEDPGQALAVLRDVPEPSDRIPVLVAAAVAQARAGRVTRALATADDIDEDRYRAIVLGRIAVVQAEAGDCAGARGSVERALATAEAIEFPYARAYATSRIAYAAARLCPADGADGVRAVDLAERVDDNRLRAEVLWSLWVDHRRAGEAEAAARARERAEVSTEAIRSALSRVWLFGDLAERHAGAAEPAESRAAFRRGMAIAEAIDNPWARARAVARMASALIALEAAGVGAGE